MVHSISKHNDDDDIKSRGRILIVDDDPDITLTFNLGLTKKGFAVSVFNDPLNALSEFRAGLYDLILLDVKMPKMNGFKLSREIEKIDDIPKVCYITSFVVYYESLKEIFPAAKVCCFIRKPIKIDKLADKIITELNGSNDPFS
jgi:DNA-binding response OmpR family regulator